MKKKPGPLHRTCAVRSNSYCGSADLHELDWTNWFQDTSTPLDGTYIHVRKPDNGWGETYHRVIPNGIKGRICHRLSMKNGLLTWLYDEVKTNK